MGAGDPRRIRAVVPSVLDPWQVLLLVRVPARGAPYDCPGAGSCTTCLDERVTFVSHDWPDPQLTDTVWFPEGTSGYTHMFERGPIETFPLPTQSIATRA